MLNKKLLSFVFVALSSGCAMDAAQPSTEQEPLGSTTSPLCKNALTQAEEQIALKQIDDICGDTWCSGDYNFAFQKLTCTTPRGTHPGTCTLNLQIIPREGVPTPRPSFTRNCKTGNFLGFDSLVNTAPSGYQSLEQGYYDALTECIMTLEAALPH